MPRSVLLSIAYDGARYSGFAPQDNGRTIAGDLFDALRVIDPGASRPRGASRTDAGVHARDQRVAFDPSREYPLSAWLGGAQRALPKEIAIRAAWYAPPGFAPSLEAVDKTYEYLIATDRRSDPFLERRTWRIPELADDDALALARGELTSLLGTHDFGAFRSARDQREVTVRTLLEASIARDAGPTPIVRVRVRGDRFMHNMVRIIVGTAVDVGRDRLAPGAVRRALASKNRRDLGMTAPPDGLYLHTMTLRGDDERARGVEPAPDAPEPSGA